jgi:tetratricopeptide (TPR) repeat protein
MGGVGKTQLALEYCLRMKESGYFRGIFWLDGSSRNSLYRAMEVIAKLLSPGQVFDDPDDAVASVRDILSKWNERWLMVIDNFDDPSDLQDIPNFFPDGRCGSILITSRYSGSKELGHALDVDRMEKSEGLELLQSPEEPEELAAAEEILTRLGYLALAIDQVRAYISRRRLRLREFIGEFEGRKKNIMGETPQFSQYRRILSDNNKTPLNLLTTWEMSLSLLGAGEDDPKTLRDILTLFSFFHPLSISEKIFSCDEGNRIPSPMSIFNDDGHWNHLKFEDAVLKMQDLSLIRFSHRGPSEIVVSLHSMVSEWLRMRLDENSQSSFFSTAVSHLENYVDSTIHKHYTTRQEAISHIDAICQVSEFETKSSSFLGACFTFGRFYRNQGRFKDTERMYCLALTGYEKKLGSEHTSTLISVNNLGILYADQGRLEEAENMYNRALAGCEKGLGPEHTSTLDTVNNLANLYAEQGRLDDAENMYNRALAGFEKGLGPEHTSTLDTVYNLANLYADQGRLEDSENMYIRALAGKEKGLGPEHTSTLGTIHNLGLLYAKQGRLEEAENMFNRALAGKEKGLGPEHMSTLRTIHNLGNLYVKQGRLEGAEKMFNRALDGSEKALGLEHKSTIKVIKSLRHLYKSQGRLEDAERMRDRLP